MATIRALTAMILIGMGASSSSPSPAPRAVGADVLPHSTLSLGRRARQHCAQARAITHEVARARCSAGDGCFGGPGVVPGARDAHTPRDERSQGLDVDRLLEARV